MARLRDSSEFRESVELLAEMARLNRLPVGLDPAARGARMEQFLAHACRRGSFSGAVLADAGGLTLAQYQCPFAPEIAAAHACILGDALARAADVLGASGADSISMDISFTDKSVVRRFEVKSRTYFLLIVCPQSVDERGELELSTEQLRSLLGES